MYALIYLPTGTQINDRDELEDFWGSMTGQDLFDPNSPEVPPKLYFNTLSEAKTFLYNSIFVLDEDIPLIGLEGVIYNKLYIIPKYKVEPVEV